MRLALFELRRFQRALLSRMALVVLTLIPLLYGALYLWAYWDPTSNLKRIPVALVNSDRAADAPNGRTVNAGAELTEELVERNVFAWRRTSAKQAEKGLADGTYHLMLVIPADFSASLASPLDSARQPQRAELRVISDDATNYLSGQLARSVFTEVRAAAARKTARGYFDQMLVSFTDLKSGLTGAADGAGQLADGSGRARDGASTVASATGRAAAGAGSLTDGLTAANRGASDLANGLAALDAGSAQLADGAARAAGYGRMFAAKVRAADDAAGPVLRENAVLIQRAAQLLAEGAEAAADHAAELPGWADAAVRSTTAVRDGLRLLVVKHPELADELAVAETAVKDTTRVRDALHAMDTATLRAKLDNLAKLSRGIADAAPHLGTDLKTARAKVDQFAAGLDQLAAGADQVHRGASRAAGGARELDGGLFRLSTGARQLDSGLASLTDGTRRLAAGMSTLDISAAELARGLSDGAGKIPGYDPDDRARRADTLGDPVELRRSTRHAAETYGVGFAPYFLGLALWVGAMISYMLLRPITRRHLMSGAPARLVAFAGWVPAALIGLVQALALFVVLRFALGLTPVHPVATLGYLFLTTITFTALLQWLGAKFGPAGRLIAIALLMLQLTSAGGTYPVQTTPGFFQALHPWLPMSYVVSGLRHLIDGGSAGTVMQGALVLAAFALGAFCLTTLAARRSKRLTPTKLHPVLVM